MGGLARKPSFKRTLLLPYLIIQGPCEATSTVSSSLNRSMRLTRAFGMCVRLSPRAGCLPW